MTLHHTKTKGDLAVAKVILDLTEKGYFTFVPVICEHLPFDIIAYKEGVSYRIQVKYSEKGVTCANASTKYKQNDFDYFAIYVPKINKILYPSIKFKGSRIVTEINNSATSFYWWEDFLQFTDTADRKQIFDFGYEMKQTSSVLRDQSHFKNRKVKRPSSKDLICLLKHYSYLKLSKCLGVSDTAIRKWVKLYGFNPSDYSGRKAVPKFYFSHARLLKKRLDTAKVI